MGNNVSAANRPKKQRATRSIKASKKTKTPKKRFSLTPKRQVGTDPATSNGLRRLSLGSSKKGKQPARKSTFGLNMNNKRDRRRSSSASTGSFGKLKAIMTPNGTKPKKQKKVKKHTNTAGRVMDKLSPNTSTAKHSKSKRSSFSSPFMKKQPRKQGLMAKVTA